MGITTSSTGDGWRPGDYERFSAERAQPFWDLLALCRPESGGRVVDLGCGTGALTAQLHQAVRASRTLGVDNSPAMLAEAVAVEGDGLSFTAGDISRFGATRQGGTYDIVFSNAALQWAGDDHRRILGQWTSTLAPAGQLAVQVPSNADHLSHLTAAELAGRQPYLGWLDGDPPADPVRRVLPPEAYAELLHELGFVEQHVRLQVYGHLLPSSAAVADWVSGTSLTRFRRRLAPDKYQRFFDEYRRVLVDRLGDRRPYFYAFKRILIWGRLPG